MIAMMSPESFIPATCCIAPLMPHPMYSFAFHCLNTLVNVGVDSSGHEKTHGRSTKTDH